MSEHYVLCFPMFFDIVRVSIACSLTATRRAVGQNWQVVLWLVSAREHV